MTLIWRNVIVDKEEKDKYIGLYQVSNLGNVRRINKNKQKGMMTYYIKTKNKIYKNTIRTNTG